MMLRISVVTIAVLLVAGPAALVVAVPAALAQLPPQPPPVKNSIQQGTDQERAACHPDVIRYCKQFIHDDGQDDVFGILGCLQTNRGKISNSCQQVLASHGQ
jgi:hypothetical protein